MRHQSLRWHRTTLLGRMPGWSRWGAPVGPWRPVRLVGAGPTPRVLDHVLETSCAGAGGRVEVRATLRVATPPEVVRLEVGEADGVLACETQADGTVVASGAVALEAVERWWPHTHGEPVRYPVGLVVDGAPLPLRSVGFRTLAADRGDGGFALAVNGVELFARGACWGPPDAVGLASSRDAVRASVRLARDTGLNLLRVPGYAVYEDAAFWDACDELGLLVWQDCMLASVDPPDDEGFWEALRPELEQLLDGVGDRPSLAVLCGSSETYQQASMYGFGAEDWTSELLEQRIPALVARRAPAIPYVASTPSGGALPFAPDEGVAHYFGVGAYLRPVADAQLSGVRFAAECLSFAIPPERATVAEAFGPVSGVGHDPRWKAATARDAGAPWDFEDVRDHYVRELFGVDPLQVRYADPARALDLGRAAVCELVEAVVTPLAPARVRAARGAIVLCWQDLWPGAGWGYVDALGRPKAPLHALRRACAPRTVRFVDDGLSGLRLVAFNDHATALPGSVELAVHLADGTVVERATRAVEIEAHGSLELSADALLGGFRDLNRAYRFAPSAYDLVHAELCDAAGAVLADAHFLPEGPAVRAPPDLGLAAALRATDAGWVAELSCARFVQYAQLDLPGYAPATSWLHLAPGARAEVALEALDGAPSVPTGVVRALNATADLRFGGKG